MSETATATNTKGSKDAAGLHRDTHLQSFLTGHCLWRRQCTPIQPQLGPTTGGGEEEGHRQHQT